MENFIAYLYCHQFIFHNFKFVLFMYVVVAHVCLLLLHTCHSNAPGVLAQKYSLKIPYDFFLSFFLSSSQIPPPWLLCAILYILQSVKKSLSNASYVAISEPRDTFPSFLHTTYTHPIHVTMKTSAKSVKKGEEKPRKVIYFSFLASSHKIF